ncbi:Ig-like domain-containing protein [Kitasatospora sp. MMS16-BH015]|uniref:L,D-transpeptidase n=1 Tax=Kitasatospora sp. MMS16-BH015 TaxID=2018025 RepID=UPI000CF2675C|nr:Ig-like domain-containing protein [Kitasatospora sp. MMS16-BH015]
MRKGLAAGVLGGALVLTVAACGGPASPTPASGGAGGAGAGAASASPKPAVSAAVVSIEPADGSKDVKPSGALKVGVAGGKLSSVRVTDKEGHAVEGALAADGSGWVPKGTLEVSQQYTVNAKATDAAGVVADSTSTFATLTPEKEAGPHDNIEPNGTYGVGMIVSLEFDRDVKDKKAVEAGITFETSDHSVVKGHWFGSRRVDFRPEQYWKPDTKVTVHYRLKSVEIAPGVYGGVDTDEPFTVGRSQISTVDASSHEMTVQRGGQTTATYPITAGKAGFDSWNGVMVIEDKAEMTRMTSEGVTSVKGEEYDLQVPHAMRLTSSGTYVHGNSWAVEKMGRSNASHGCIGIQDTKSGSSSSNAGKFFDSSLIGDVVKVVNSDGATVEADNGLSGWNVPWGSW